MVGYAPRGDRVTAARGAALAAAERVVDRVHGDAAHVRALAQPAAAAGLADRDVLVVEVADLADGGDAVEEELPDLARGHLHRDVVAFLGHHLHRRAGAAGELAALADLELDVVHHRAERDVPQGQAVAGQDVDRVAGDDGVAHLQPEGLEDVALLAVGVVHEGDARRAVRVVLDRGDLGRDVRSCPA